MQLLANAVSTNEVIPMRRMMISSSVFFCGGMMGAIILISLGLPAAAQPPKSAVPAPANKPEPPRPVDAEPNSTLASFGDWTLRCQRVGNGAETQRVCEVTQQIRAQDQQNPVAELAIGRLNPLHLTIVLPVNVTFLNPPSFTVDGKALELLDLGWRKCLPGGCIADAALTEDMLRRWKIQTSAGRIAWTDAAGRDFTIELSFRGLTQALDALSKEP